MKIKSSSTRLGLGHRGLLLITLFLGGPWSHAFVVGASVSSLPPNTGLHKPATPLASTTTVVEERRDTEVKEGQQHHQQHAGTATADDGFWGAHPSSSTASIDGREDRR